MEHIALISEHASPLAPPGSVDSGGQNIYVGHLAANLAEHGYTVDVFTRKDNAFLPPVIPYRAGVRIINIEAGPARYVPKEQLMPFMEQFAGGMLEFIQHNQRYDLLHANFWMSGLVAAEIRRALAIPYVITFHALGRVRRLHQGEADTFPDQRPHIEERLIQECDGIIAECPQDRLDLLELYHADSAKIEIVPCGFDPGELMPVPKAEARRRLGFEPNVPLIMQLGRILPRKGIETAIRGFAGFFKDHSRNALLAIVGGAGRKPDPGTEPEIQRLMTIAREEGVGGNVVFTGRAERDELKYYYSAADVFVTTPWYEPFGMTPLESMACGTPVIGSNVGGLKFSIAHGRTGFLVPPDSPRHVTHYLASLFSSPRLLRAMGRNAIRRVHDSFTWKKVVRKIVKFYHKVVEQKPFAVPVATAEGLRKEG